MGTAPLPRPSWSEMENLGINRTKSGSNLLKTLYPQHLHPFNVSSQLRLAKAYLPHPREGNGVGRDMRNLTRLIISKGHFLEKQWGSPPGSATNSKDIQRAREAFRRHVPWKGGENGPWDRPAERGVAGNYGKREKGRAIGKGAL